MKQIILIFALFTIFFSQNLEAVKGSTPAQERDLKSEKELSEARDIYLKKKDYPKALERFQSLTARSPEKTALWIEQAQVAYLDGNTKLAMSSLAKAETLKPTPSERHDIALGYQNLKLYDKTQKILENLMKEDPKNAQYLRDAGVCEFLKGNKKAAAENLNKAIELNPKLLSAYISLASIHQANGEKDAALRLYETALAQKSVDKSEESYRSSILKHKKELLKTKARR